MSWEASDNHVDRLLERAEGGDGVALGELLNRYRDRLHRMVRLRMDRRLQGRLDPSDVIQDACLEAGRRFPEYCRQAQVPFFIWLRFLTGQRLSQLQRFHLGTRARAVDREVTLQHGPWPAATSAALAAKLVGHLTSPSSAAVRAEIKLRLQEALNAMEPLDREVLTLRHFEQLSNSECAHVMGVSPTAACNRYVRALERLKKSISDAPGEIGEWLR